MAVSHPAGSRAGRFCIAITWLQTAICCACENEKILALGLCATCYTLKRQDAEYFGGLRERVRERVQERDGHSDGVYGDPDPGCILGNRAILCCI
jgi:hypothetical protein